VTDHIQTKAAVTVAEMARMVGLSRARFYQLVTAGVLPRPSRQAETGRPFYAEEAQEVCLEVRRRNCGVNGQPVLFYARRLPTSTKPARPKRQKASRLSGEFADLLKSVQMLGLTTANLADVEAAVKQQFPLGVGTTDPGEVIRAVFLFLKRQNRSDSVGR
jgi:predicted DNA-binding transcriptional regulator AlpA